ncbi:MULTISPECIES: MFS transporter [unclassified Breznakia]|uniref:MFS transporter n=1 Tax=unclassified Breznakia TaxID=2623764 RepID=UPI00247602AF|nr:MULTISPECIES: MFS transporter [unclassified Breznakia]MDH6366914.1 UMF1 family MFS transporter [Breznakia sp. PH1-1]MDH6404092.1 UMF1 family MFS transporter [Breznakia sp. PF1-11]MDH6411801.1 UMF1 family MFS transporter [Breznakia sp. PFB1-11]MDH6414080.1 UMF1 family MFS transporter [Breznakia sp. PFB1-14]MDH6416563.1 UMF1 family MFS transporter [Breznakia sp. PFB1-4]
MKQKLTKLEKYWILYDVGNSAFIMLVSTIIPIYFNFLATEAHISEVDYLAYWGYAASISTLIVAFIGPILGTISDTKGYRKPVFMIALGVGVLGCASLSLTSSWKIFLCIFVIAKVGYAASLIFYDSMLADITTEERMDEVSSHGYAWGYIGSCIPFIISLIFVLFNTSFGLSLGTAMMIAFMINALWWLANSIPLLKNYKQTHYIEKQAHPIRASFQRLGFALKDLKANRKVLFFLIAFFFYIDGVYTIIEMATAYGSALGLDSQGLLLALLVTQLVAFPFALLFGKLSKSQESTKLIKLCILAYTGIAIFALQLDKQWEFWVLAVCVGMFQGAIQALSRSYFAKIIPKEKSGEFFGIYDICGKGASFLGTFMMGLFAQITGFVGGGIIVLVIMFIIGYIFFHKASQL